MCSRVTDSSAPFCADLVSEWHPKTPKEDKTLENDLPREEGEAPGQKEETDDVRAGNPDIQVPDSVKSEEGECAGRTREEKDAEEENNEERRTEIVDREDNEGDGKNSRPHLGRTEPRSMRETPTEGQESPERLKLCNVPGGTWLTQKERTQLKMYDLNVYEKRQV
ncbi:hypothetical protein NDU88_001760 [Pleurodeles waltl]|uniref:Uncharacterized protein n=1 Tax=Pleurodeles waltl TaxID=8319 RepID=A0AAV7UTN4_PLEWA|nr:hypothetical protein NDU88_001760 [Pleurodeles waltl]